MMSADSKIKTLERGRDKVKTALIEAACEMLAESGPNAMSVRNVATRAGVNHGQVHHYFGGKEDIHVTLLNQLMKAWLDPLKEMNPNGDPIKELLGYVHRKLDMALELPRESRLFANEILQGAPRILHALNGPLKKLTDEKATIINSWISDKRINSVEPYHLIFSIWAITQHYADFDVQILAVMGKNNAQNRFDDANKFLKELFTRLLEPKVKLKEPLL